jgi:hypothetical protein
LTYIGQQPATTFDSGIQDRFTGLTTNTVTLNHEISAEEDILVVWNNIVQDKNTYSVGGTGNKTVTLGGTLVSGDVVTVYYLNKVMQSVNPTAGSVGAEQINDGIITKAKLADQIDIFSGTSLNAADLGTGLHIKTADSGGSVSTDADELVLENSAGVGMTMLGGTGNDLCINFGDSGDNNIGRIIYANNGNNMMFHTNDAEKMRIDGDGHIAINGTAKLGTYSTGILSVTADIGNTDQGITIKNTNAAYNAEHMFMEFLNSSGARAGVISHTAATTTAYTTSSDYRLKENETNITDGINRLKQLKPYKFNFKADKDTTVDGFFAHEVSSIVPEAIIGEKDAVTKDDNPIYQGIDQSKLVPLLTSALQEAITKIESLEARVKTLEDA